MLRKGCLTGREESNDERMDIHSFLGTAQLISKMVGSHRIIEVDLRYQFTSRSTKRFQFDSECDRVVEMCRSNKLFEETEGMHTHAKPTPSIHGVQCSI